MLRPPPRSPLFPFTTLFRSGCRQGSNGGATRDRVRGTGQRGSTRCEPHDPHTHRARRARRSEEHTSELQSHVNLVCRLLLEKKNSPALLNYRARTASATTGI